MVHDNDQPSGVIDLREMGAIPLRDEDMRPTEQGGTRGPDTIMAVAMPSAPPPRAADWGPPAFMLGSFMLVCAMLLLLISKQRVESAEPVIREIPVDVPVAAAEPAVVPAASAATLAEMSATQSPPPTMVVAPVVAPVTATQRPASPKPRDVVVSVARPDPGPPESSLPVTTDDFESRLALQVADLEYTVDRSAAVPSKPAEPSRSEVKEALRAVHEDVRRCTRGQDDLPAAARVRLTVLGRNGRVHEVRVQNMMGNTAACIGRAVKGARFPVFERREFNVVYPFKL